MMIGVMTFRNDFYCCWYFFTKNCWITSRENDVFLPLKSLLLDIVLPPSFLPISYNAHHISVPKSLVYIGYIAFRASISKHWSSFVTEFGGEEI